MKLKISIYLLISVLPLINLTIQGMEIPQEKVEALKEAVTLKSNDGQKFTLSEDAAELSGTLKDLIADVGVENITPDNPLVLKISGDTLKKVVSVLTLLAKQAPNEIKYLKAYKPTPQEQKEITSYKESANLIHAYNYLDIPFVLELKDKEGDILLITLGAAMNAETIKDVIEDAGIMEPIPLSISSKVLSRIIILLNKLYPLVKTNKTAEEADKIYIPHAYQPKVNQAVSDLDNKELGELFSAANYLNVPFILNALAAVIADRLHDKISFEKEVDGKTVNKTLDEQLEDLKKVFSDEEFGKVIPGPDRYILKHVTLRKRGINKEYSIADYAKDHVLPEGENLDLGNRGLTSLFGIKRLRNPEAIMALNLSRNGFYSFDLDLQEVKNPFEKLSKLQRLDLQHNQLIKVLPESLFKGLGKLTQLDLGFNRLKKLPKGLFKGLDSLKMLILQNNQLIMLPQGLFEGLNNLKDIYLRGNQLSEENEKQLKRALPKVYLDFTEGII